MGGGALVSLSGEGVYLCLWGGLEVTTIDGHGDMGRSILLSSIRPYIDRQLNIAACIIFAMWEFLEIEATRRLSLAKRPTYAKGNCVVKEIAVNYILTPRLKSWAGGWAP